MWGAIVFPGVTTGKNPGLTKRKRAVLGVEPRPELDAGGVGQIRTDRERVQSLRYERSGRKTGDGGWRDGPWQSDQRMFVSFGC
jgi:hypothetical protein